MDYEGLNGYCDSCNGFNNYSSLSITLMNLTAPIKEAGLTYRLKASALERLGILTIEDLLLHLPFRYEDYTNAVKLSELKIDTVSVITGKILEIKNEYTKKRFVLQKAILTDGEKNITCMWFNQPYITRVISPGDEVGLVGKLEFFGKSRTFQVKDYEILSSSNGIHTTGLVPVYSETRGLSSKWIRNRIYDILINNKDAIDDFLPGETIEKQHLPTLIDALISCHFPKSLTDAQKARERLAFNELLLIQLSSLKRRREWEAKRKGMPFRISDFRLQISEFIKSLPFELTNGQKEAVEAIKEDLQKEIPMNRLLEGDVGSGKTVVAAIAMYIAYLNGFQSVLMAPTQILAEQHYKTVSQFLSPFGLKIGLMTGSRKIEVGSLGKNNSQPPNSNLLAPDITVGTHALIQKGVSFQKLGLVVIDEQQRFGVEQRAVLREKGKAPHFLTMTATPIPRTVLLAAYKDLDVSLLKEMPLGRKNIKTWLVPQTKRKDGYAWINKQIVESNFSDQAFIVCPFIEESESMVTVKAVKVEFEKLSRDDFKNLKLGLLHGKLTAKEKTEVLRKFCDKEINILVATPVVEVGIDIPDATIMVIEAADRFGLSQLHQLRGRVGRGDKQSYCLLFTESETENTKTRLSYMEHSYSGFELAELDLKLRGPGNMFGTAQHGLAGFKIADFSNFSLVEKAKKESEALLPKLSKYPKLLERTENVSLKLVHPD